GSLGKEHRNVRCQKSVLRVSFLFDGTMGRSRLHSLYRRQLYRGPFGQKWSAPLQIFGDQGWLCYYVLRGRGDGYRPGKHRIPREIGTGEDVPRKYGGGPYNKRRGNQGRDCR